MATEGWRNGLFSFPTIGNCCYALCCPPCAIASAKSRFDGSSWIFNCCCFGTSPMFVKNYIRMGYNIEGRIGGDCCESICCGCCSINQMLNETEVRGQKINSVATRQESDWIAPMNEFSILGDPCDCLCVFMWGNVENAAIYSQLSGLPIWFLMGGCGGTPLNVCQTRHIVRKSYGIGGNDVMDDCVWPLVFTGILSCWAPCWFYKELARMRAEIAHRGRPINFMANQSSSEASATAVPVKNYV